MPRNSNNEKEVMAKAAAKKLLEESSEAWTKAGARKTRKLFGIARRPVIVAGASSFLLLWMCSISRVSARVRSLVEREKFIRVSDDKLDGRFITDRGRWAPPRPQICLELRGHDLRWRQVCSSGYLYGKTVKEY